MNTVNDRDPEEHNGPPEGPENDPMPPRPDMMNRQSALGRIGDTAEETLEHIRRKMEMVASEFSEGKINRAQFNAVYGHYGEQRIIIERLIERNPGTNAWRRVASPGRTDFLRNHFEAHPVYFIVFQHQRRDPLATGGEQPDGSTQAILRAIKHLWSLDDIPENGLARQEIDENHCLVLANGKLAVTIVIYALQPAQAQIHIVRDLHTDFERANRLSLQRNLPADMMVFPQRSLFPG